MLCTLPSFLYWEVFEPVQSYILACLSNIDNIFTDLSFRSFIHNAIIIFMLLSATFKNCLKYKESKSFLM